MTDTQSPTTESQTTIDDARARSRRSFIAVLKANRDVFSNLPERIEQWLEKETGATNQPETTKHGRDESERLARSDLQKQLECFQGEINANTQSLVTLDQTVREMTAALEAMKSVHSSMVFSRDRYVERELKEKEDTIEANKEQLKLVEEENLKLKEELKKEEKEAKDKITKQEERIASLEGEQEKKERQIVEITREEKEKTEGLINEHQKEVDKLLREIQTMKEKLLKKSDYIQKMYEDYNKNLADHKSRNDALLKELEKREEEIAKYTQIIARLESEQEKKEKQIVKITREEKEKTEGLTNEHQKEVDKLLREIQAMKEKNDTLLKEKEVEITNYTQMNLKLKEELKKEEKVAKEREERIALLEGEQEKKERQIVEIAKEVKEKTEGLTNEHQKEVDKLIREIKTTKERNDTLLKELENMEEEITKHTQIIARLESELEKKERQIVEIAREEEEKIEVLKNDHQKEVDKLLREIQTMKEKLLKKSDYIQKMYEDYNKNLADYKSRNDTLLKKLEKKEKEMTKYTQIFQRKEETYKSDLTLKETELSKTKERLSHREKEVRTLVHEVQPYKSRLASLCEKRESQDQRSLGNVRASNRPSDVESDFKVFFDGVREDARDVIQSVYGSEKKKDVHIYYPRIVCTILVAAYEVTKNVKEAVLDLFKVSTKKLILKAPEVGQKYNLTRMEDNFFFNPITIDVRDKSEESTDVIDALLNSLKESARICNLECLEKDVCEYAWKIWNEWYEENSSFTLAPSQKVLTDLSDCGYIAACLRLAWRMVTQLPPLRLEYNSSTFDHRIHKKANGDTSSEEIMCYLWPCLFDGGARLICPGLVLCKM